ncbi:MAG: 30S ribosomal protein S6 [Candidatus Marinimicrobia bacterium]|nr:30S ribosomal protein S6 [Candidatus Neomarinimicrobiota bacterium]
MRYYENLFIINPHLEGPALETLMGKIKSEMSDAGANLLKVEELGKKRLAYQIKHQKYGSYVLLIFESEQSAAVRKFEDWMNIQEDVLANLTVKLDEKPDLTKATVLDDPSNDIIDNQ